MPELFDKKDKMKGERLVGPVVQGAAMAGFPVWAGMGLGGTALMHHIFGSIESGKWGPVEADPEGLAKKLLAAGGRTPEDISKFTVSLSHHPYGPHYAWHHNEHLQLPKSLATPMIVSHEAGHASATNPFSKALRAVRGNRLLPFLAPGLLLGGTLASDRDATEMNLAQKAALPVALLHAAGVQGEELRASLLGKHLLKQIGRETPHFWKHLLSTQGTYALGNLASIAPILGGTYALKKVLERRQEAKGMKKTSSQIANDVLQKVYR